MAHEGKDQQIEFQFDGLGAQIDREMTNLSPISSESSPVVGEPLQQLRSEDTLGNKTELSQTPCDSHVGPGALAVDFEQFAARLDEEIDEMLVTSTPGDYAEEPILSLEPASADHAGEHPDSTQSLHDAEKRIEPSEKELGFDFEAFAAQIDEEIDNLLIPSTDVADEDAEAATPHPAASDVSAKPTQETQSVDTSQYPKSNPAEETPDTEGKPVVALLEALSVAYLSLDWDFSEKNIINLKCTLERLNQYCRQDKQIDALYRIFMTVVNRMKADRKSVDRQLLDFVREAQALLKLLLLSGHTNGAYEKEQLKKLITRLQAIKAKRIPDQQEPTDTTQKQLTICAAMTKKDPDSVVFPLISKFNPDDLRELKEWIEIFGNHCRNAAQSIELEQKRLHLLEENLAQKPALIALVERLTKIRLNLATPMTSFKGMESECGNRIRWITDFEKAVQQTRPNMLPQIDEELGKTQESSPDKPLVDTEQNKATVKEFDLFFLDISGWRVGIPAVAVVKVNAVSTNKLETIFKRGYATIQDLTSLFGRRRNGLLGGWKETPMEELRKYQFKVIDLNIPPLETTPPSPSMVVLVSNGSRHGMLIAQRGDTEHPISARVILEPSDGGLFLGRIQNEAGLSVGVLDADKLLSLVEQQ